MAADVGLNAWRADSVGPESAWRFRVPSGCAPALLRAARGLAESAVPLVETQLDPAARSGWWGEFAPVREALEEGRGFAIVEAPGGDELPPSVLAALYWVVGQLLGNPVAQNVQGVRLYDVRDTGQSVAQGARFSVTNAESTFHTDASFEDDVVDYVGLLCLRSARAGGLSQIVSGYAVVEELAGINPTALEELTRPFHVDRRGGVRPGEAPTAFRPVLDRSVGTLLYRYLRTWIEVGHEKVGVPLAPEQRQALDVLDAVVSRPDLRAEFMLRPGEMFFINNRWILHNRTAFEDHAEPERRRHYVRLWLKRVGAAHDLGA